MSSKHAHNQWNKPLSCKHLIQNQCCCLGTTKRSLNSHQTLFLVRGYFWAQAYFHPFPSSHFPWSFCSHYVDCFSLSMTSVNALATLLEAFFNILGQQTDTSLNPGYYFTPAALDALLPTLQKSICYFDNCICHQNCNCWLQYIVPCGSQLLAIQHTCSTGTAEVAKRAGKFA